MTDPDGTLARIDDTLEAWERGPDAYRWQADGETDDERGVRRLEFVSHALRWVIADPANPEAPTSVELDAGIDLTQMFHVDGDDEPIFTPGMRGAIRVGGLDIPIVVDEVQEHADGGSVWFTIQREEDT